MKFPYNGYKNGQLSAKIDHKSGYEIKFRKLEEGTFLQVGRQTPVHPQVMYPLLPPRASTKQNESKLLTKHVYRINYDKNYNEEPNN